jgi:hypothetical protein
MFRSGEIMPEAVTDSPENPQFWGSAFSYSDDNGKLAPVTGVGGIAVTRNLLG